MIIAVAVGAYLKLWLAQAKLWFYFSIYQRFAQNSIRLIAFELLNTRQCVSQVRAALITINRSITADCCRRGNSAKQYEQYEITSVMHGFAFNVHEQEFAIVKIYALLWHKTRGARCKICYHMQQRPSNLSADYSFTISLPLLSPVKSRFKPDMADSKPLMVCERYLICPFCT